MDTFYFWNRVEATPRTHNLEWGLLIYAVGKEPCLPGRLKYLANS